jgi:hypothetical protein
MGASQEKSPKETAFPEQGKPIDSLVKGFFDRASMP